MGEPFRYRCEITPGFLEQAGPDLHLALLARHDRVVPVGQARLRPVLKLARFAGLGAAGLGIALAGYSIAVTPYAPCHDDRLLRYHLWTVVFVLSGTFLWFAPRVAEAVTAWARRQLERRASQLLAPLRKRAPYSVTYALAEGRLEARVEELKLVRVTELRRVGAAVATRSLACLYRGRDTAWLHRVVYFPDDGARRAVVEALRCAGCEVQELAGG